MRWASPTPDLRNLCLRAQSGDAEAREQIIQASMGLVVRTAQRFFRAGAFLEIGDLIQQGCLGILYAIDKFDAQRKVQGRHIGFLTYAYYWVVHCIRREIENQGLTIAIPVERLNQPGLCIPRAYSLDGQDESHSELPIGSWLEQCSDVKDTPDQWCRERENREYVERLLALLSQKQRDVLKHRFGLLSRGEDLTQKQLAEQLQISPSRVGTLERTALLHLKRYAVLAEI